MKVAYFSLMVKPSRHYFTLVEMLVVMAILAILCALLVPALRSANVSAMRISCFDKLKRQGSGFCLFAEDNNGYLPQLRGPNSTPKLWISLIKSGVDGDTSVFFCPSEANNGSVADYGPNDFYISVGRSAPGPYFSGSIGRYRSLNSVRSSSETFLLVDAKDATGKKGDWQVDTKKMLENGILTGNYYMKPWPPRHGEGMNWLFFDQHVEWLTGSNMISFDEEKRNSLFGYPVP